MNILKLDNSVKRVYLNGSMRGNFDEVFHNLKSVGTAKRDDAETFSTDIEKEFIKNLIEEAIKLEKMSRMRKLTESEAKTVFLGRAFMENKNEWKPSSYANSLIIFTGDCGIGVKKPEYYNSLFEKLNKILQYNNIHIAFVRGGNDNPSFFDGKTIDYSNIKALSDYTVITLPSIEKNILCVGGGTSLARWWRMSKEKRINSLSKDKKTTLYWPNESVVFDKEKVDEIISNGIKIDMVVSHTSPSFVEPQTIQGLKKWREKDKTLESDIEKDRLALDHLYEHLRDANSRPFFWVYGYFDIDNVEERSHTIFRSLSDSYSPFDCTCTLTGEETEDTSKKSFFGGKKKVKLVSHEHRNQFYDLPLYGNDIGMGIERPVEADVDVDRAENIPQVEPWIPEEYDALDALRADLQRRIDAPAFNNATITVGHV